MIAPKDNTSAIKMKTVLERHIFRIAFLISLITHGVIFLQSANLNIFPLKIPEQKLEVSYVKEIPKPKEEEKTLARNQEPLLKIPSRIGADKKMPLPFLDIQNLKPRPSNPNFMKPAIAKPDIIAVKKKITIPPIDINKISSPSYLSYYQIVREKIKRTAYQNFTRTDTGEIYLTFIISNDGYLKEIRLIEEKSSLNPYLREIALKSVKEAAPFPNFPKELDYLQLSFNVIISFQIE
ncbi:MAG: hypothetical protein NC928_04740 [Candidatus Omnitrophica bacterium]|nr:hypothetical protein [Candidatus Omnitrophota bacterium]